MSRLPAWLLLLGLAAGCARPSGPNPRVIVLGIDGFDPQLLERFTSEGVLPHFQKLIQEGDYRPLQTTMPPLSPVAWSTFITGTEPISHGIFDFLHRNPDTIQPEFSMSRAIPSTWTLELGSWVIPLRGGSVEQLRGGRAFWEILEEHEIDSTIYRMPVNFPPAPAGHSLSGMGTPDVLGTPGTFSFYTDSPPPDSENISGGRVYPVSREGQRIRSRLYGPDNVLRRVRVDRPGGREEWIHPKMEVEFQVDFDPLHPIARLTVGGQEFLLQQGEWTDWIRVDFEALPWLVGVSAVCRFYLQEIRPNFRLYVTPLQINPEAPVMPITHPEDWAGQLQRDLGYFYTQELPEDTKAYSAGIFSAAEFWEQSQFVYREQRRALERALSSFQEGFLFFYFSSVDQGCHMLWRNLDPSHPAHQPDPQLAGAVRTLYQQMDEALGRVLQSVDSNTTLIVMSDHGFGPFSREVNLNSWLAGQGYVRLIDPLRRDGYPLFTNVDWSATQAYALGLNGLYVNLRGREEGGIVSQGEDYRRLLDRLEADLLAMVDPETGQNPVSLVVRTGIEKRPGPSLGPDLIVGYNHGYRSSWKNPLGEFPRAIFNDNLDAWSGDHSVDHRLVPGVLLTNRRITLDQPALFDVTVAVLDEFGISPPQEMVGRDCLSSASKKEH